MHLSVSCFQHTNPSARSATTTYPRIPFLAIIQRHHVYEVKMCKQYLCYYKTCKHEVEDGISPCRYERKYPGTCRGMEEPDTDEEAGLCDFCRQKKLEESARRLRALKESLKSSGHSETSLEYNYPQLWEKSPAWKTKKESNEEYSRSSLDSEACTIIERSPRSEYRGRCDLQDSREYSGNGSMRGIYDGRTIDADSLRSRRLSYY